MTRQISGYDKVNSHHSHKLELMKVHCSSKQSVATSSEISTTSA